MSYHVSDPSEVWKHYLDIEAINKGEVIRVQMPPSAEIIHFGAEEERFCIWEVHKVRVRERRAEYEFFFTGTGHAIPGHLLILDHVGSIQQNYFVWHLFRVSDQSDNMEPEGD